MRNSLMIIGTVTMLGATLAADADETVTYEYDALGRLVKVVHEGTVNDDVKVTYTLDAAGNRVTVVADDPGN